MKSYNQNTRCEGLPINRDVRLRRSVPDTAIVTSLNADDAVPQFRGQSAPEVGGG